VSVRCPSFFFYRPIFLNLFLSRPFTPLPKGKAGISSSRCSPFPCSWLITHPPLFLYEDLDSQPLFAFFFFVWITSSRPSWFSICPCGCTGFYFAREIRIVGLRFLLVPWPPGVKTDSLFSFLSTPRSSFLCREFGCPYHPFHTPSF